MIKRWLSRTGTFFLYLLSLLPFWFLYCLSDLLFVILYYLIGYRRKVVQENLSNAFPEKTAYERHAIERKYYRYLSDLVMETIKMVTISEKEIMRRMKPSNPEVMAEYLARDINIIAVASHYCNWEMAALRFGLSTNKKRLIVYKPLTNAVFNDFFNNVRSRFGSMMISMKQTLRKIAEYKNENIIIVLASDQTPVRDDTNYFMEFLNQPTAVFLGIERLAKMVDGVVAFYKIELVKRGYYKFTFVPLVEEPKKTAPFEITGIHVEYLESMIRERPEYWLWSHRRWKFKPEDMQQ